MLLATERQAPCHRKMQPMPASAWALMPLMQTNQGWLCSQAWPTQPLGQTDMKMVPKAALSLRVQARVLPIGNSQMKVPKETELPEIQPELV